MRRGELSQRVKMLRERATGRGGRRRANERCRERAQPKAKVPMWEQAWHGGGPRQGARVAEALILAVGGDRG